MRGPIKIGCSFLPNIRRSALETWSPFPLEIVAEITGSMIHERRFHTLFRDQHRGREWFDWSPELQAVIDQISEGKFDLASLPAAQRLPRKTPRQGNGWSDKTRLSQSYAMRIYHAEKKHGRFLPPELTDWRKFVTDTEQMKPINDFIADPNAHGLTLRERNKRLADNLRSLDYEWARARAAELDAEAEAA
jgi:hypothetical protein